VRNLQTLCHKPTVLVKLRAANTTTSRRHAHRLSVADSHEQHGADMPPMDDDEECTAAHRRSSRLSVAPTHASVEFVSATPSASGFGLELGLGSDRPTPLAASLLLGGAGPSPAEEAKLGALQFDHAADDDDEHENEPLGGQGHADMDEGDEAASGSGGLLNLAAPVRAERIAIGYARVSKKVDVKALKSTMWTALQPAAAKAQNAAPAAPAPVQSFSSAIRSVAGLARGELASQLSDITPSYYFISLLHLCNEHNLALEDGPHRSEHFGDFNIIQQ